MSCSGVRYFTAFSLSVELSWGKFLHRSELTRKDKDCDKIFQIVFTSRSSTSTVLTSLEFILQQINLLSCELLSEIFYHNPYPFELAHFYAGTFPKTVKALKERG